MDYKNVSLNDFNLFGEGATAIVYVSKADDSLLLKLFKKDFTIEAVMSEYQRSKNAEILGLRVPLTLDIVTCNNCFGITYKKLLNKVSFSKAISKDANRLEEVMRQFAKECKKMHSIIVPETVNIPSKQHHLLELIPQIKQLNQEEKDKLINLVTNVTDSRTVLHGDLHTGNIVYADNEIYWIDLGGLSYGNPLFDLGTTAFFFNIACKCEPLRESFHMTTEQMLLGWRFFVKEYFNNEDEQFVDNKTKELLPYQASILISSATELGIPESLFMPFLRDLISSL